MDADPASAEGSVCHFGHPGFPSVGGDFLSSPWLFCLEVWLVGMSFGQIDHTPRNGTDKPSLAEVCVVDSRASG